MENIMNTLGQVNGLSVKVVAPWILISGEISKNLEMIRELCDGKLNQSEWIDGTSCWCGNVNGLYITLF